MLNKKQIIEKANKCSKNDLAIIESFLAIFNKAIFYNEQGIAINVIDLA